ncbi:phosphomannomutase [Rhizobium paknamense]|uniref:Phosphomannomutase n=1 Tax=Rhizobium paknamense TaxID=1206817 RepID=A0ABU0IBB6_9HYPH|nr:phosphomannomutase [Rhizobium paknamense]MDQ0455524.1 phosphomannomutase [Rhizobium paknamense]
MAVKFGTSGLRGLSSELVGRVSALYVTAFVKMLEERQLAAKGAKVLVGQDFRPSSPDIAATAMAAILRAGFQPVDCGTLPTPALALYGQTIGAASIMITGSHIPADRNGIKFYRPDGEIDKEDEAILTALADRLADDADANRVEAAGGPDESEAAQRLFLERYRNLLPDTALKGLRVGVYQHSSVGRDLLVTILEGFGAEVVALGRSESFIPVDTEAVSEETRQMLASWAKAEPFFAIVSTDGDADRPLVVDEAGEPLRGDLLGLITARFLNAEVIATPVTSNSGIEVASGMEVIRTRVGSPYVIAAMQAARDAGKRGVMGFEANGGVMLASDFPLENGLLGALPTRDCVLPILAALGSAAAAKTSLSGLAARHALPIALSDRLENYAQNRSSSLMSHLTGSEDNLKAFLAPIGTPASTSLIDGLRITLADARVIHFRPSGNAPEMRCYVEAADEASATSLLAQGLAALGNWQR